MSIPEYIPAPGHVAGLRVMVTGAGRGLGPVIAAAFSRAGAHVALVGRTESDLDATASQLSGKTLVLTADVRNPTDNDAAVDQIVEHWGGLDVAILNAGISPVVADPVDLDLDVWREIMDVNLTGVFLGARASARVMERGGRIIATGSALGERPMRGLSAYSTSKAGLIGLVRALAVDFGPRGITVNAVSPGWFDSPLAEPWMANERRSDQILGHTALSRWGNVAELAGAFLYLASEAASFVTGTVLSVDGGYLTI
jgi:NAD(P)-dependent dehydrogenase (short-subunit alcohol dehydrogenase family)